MSKIYCCIYNGLGNQLFGYALGLYLSKKYKRDLIIDLTKLNFINFLSKTGLKTVTQREYELNKIGFITPVKKFQYFEFFKRIKSTKWSNYIFADFRDKHFELNPNILQKHIYNIGWGNFNIVKQVLPELRKQFAPNFELRDQFLEAKKVILNNNSIAIHIRRTDYLDPKISDFSIGICTEEYYENAIQYIKEKIENPYFVIFSDDIEYVKQNFNIKNSYIVEGNTGYEDLYLMSLCKHFILANSTFGFWAAILNSEKNKTICVPEYWYNNPLRMADYIPEEWMKIPIK